MRSNYKKIAKFVKQVSTRNVDLSVTDLKGISINKVFMPSVANVNGTDLSKYKVVEKEQFAFNPMHVGRDEVLPISMLEQDEKVIVSPAYVVFEIIDKDELDPEYLMMWCRRPEFDRNAWFTTDNSVRGGFSWDDFCDMELPVPSIEKQREIVKEYNVIINRINLNEQLNQKLEETAQAIYKQWFEDFEFPISEEYATSINRPDLIGKSYKSNGGEIIYNKELEVEIPNDWKVKSLKSIASIKGGKRLPKGESLITERTSHPYIKVADMGDYKFTLLNQKIEYLEDETYKSISRYTVSSGDLIISIVGTIGVVKIIHDSLDKANLTENCVKVTNIKEINADYLYYFLNSYCGKNQLEMKIVGGVQSKLPIYNIESFKITCPDDKTINSFSKIIAAINNNQKSILLETTYLYEFKNLLLSRMASKQLEAVS